MNFLTKRYLVTSVCLIAGVEILLITLLLLTPLNFSEDVNFTIFTVTPLFILTILQLVRGESVQRAAFVKDYASKFFTDVALYNTFYDLVYTYGDEIYDEVDKAIKKAEKEGALNDHTARPVFDVFSNLQGQRSEGRRYFHPKYFQKSQEERQLDALLGYLDLLAYYHHRQLIPIADIAGSLGFYLNILARRKAIRATRQYYSEAAELKDYKEKNGRLVPFHYLDNLLDKIIEYDIAQDQMVKKAKGPK